LLFIVVKSIWWIVAVPLLAVAIGFTYLHYTQPVYQSTGVVQISSENRANTLLDMENIYEKEDISKNIEVLRSPEFFKRVLASLPLEVSYYTEGEILYNE